MQTLRPPVVSTQPGFTVLIQGVLLFYRTTEDEIDICARRRQYSANGEGVPVFMGKQDASLRLIDVRTWQDSDNVLVQYEVRHKNA
jgi:hypothetical protein